MNYAIVDYCAVMNKVHGFHFTKFALIEKCTSEFYHATITQVFGLTYADFAPVEEAE